MDNKTIEDNKKLIRQMYNENIACIESIQRSAMESCHRRKEWEARLFALMIQHVRVMCDENKSNEDLFESLDTILKSLEKLSEANHADFETFETNVSDICVLLRELELERLGFNMMLAPMMPKLS